MVGEIIAEKLHGFFVRTRKMPLFLVGTRHLLHSFVETDQINPAVQTFEQSDYFFGVPNGIILSRPAYILKTHAALVSPVILLEKGNDIGDGHDFLRRHDLGAFCAEGVVHRDRQVALAFVQKPLHGRYSNRRDSNPFGRPRTAVGGCHDLKRTQHLVYIIHRLALTHIDDIRERFTTVGEG